MSGYDLIQQPMKCGDKTLQILFRIFHAQIVSNLPQLPSHAITGIYCME